MSLDQGLSETEWPDSQASITEMWPRRQVADSGGDGSSPYVGPGGYNPYLGPPATGPMPRWPHGAFPAPQPAPATGSGSVPPIDPTTGQPTQPPSTTPSSGFDLGGMFNTLQTTTVLGIPVLWIIVAGVIYFFFIKKGR